MVATALAYAALRVLQQIMPSSVMFHAPHAIAVEGRTLLFTFCLAILSGFVFGLLPALRATRLAAADAGGGLAPHTSTHAGGSAALRRVLVTAEVALSVTLLVGAGLLMSSFLKLARVDPGIELERLAVLEFSASAVDYPDEASRAAYVRLVEERVRALPGVEATAMTFGMPPRGSGLMFGVALQPEGGEPHPQDAPLPHTNVGPDFFDVTGARLLAGRAFHRGEDHESDVVIIDEDLAAYLWPGRSAVGVMGDLKLMGPDDRRTDFEVLYPVGAYEELGGGTMVIRTAGDPRRLLQPVRAAVHQVDPRQLIGTLDTAETLYAESIDMQRFLYLVITTLAGLALALSVVGLYGLLSYGVARRRREIGVRLALGARGAQVRRLILDEALALTAIGAVLGAAGAFAMSRFIESALYGVEPTDPRTYLAVVGVIFAAAGLAALLPAHRAVRVDPAVVLRTD